MDKINPWSPNFWGENPREKFEFIVNLAYLSIGLSFLSLIFHIMGHSSHPYSNPNWMEEGTSYYLFIFLLRFPFFFWLINETELLTSIEFGYHYVTQWHFFSILSFPLFHGYFLMYAFKKDSAIRIGTTNDKDYEGILCVFFTILVIKDLFFNFKWFIEYEFDFEIMQIVTILLEIIFTLALLLFTISIIIGVKPNTSKFLPGILFFAIIYTLLSLHDYWEDYSWISTEMSITYNLYILLQLVTLPLFWYSMSCLYIYRDTIENWDETSGTHQSNIELPESASGWDERADYIKKTNNKDIEETETSPDIKDSIVEPETAMGELEKLIQKRNIGEVTTEEFEEMKSEIMNKKIQHNEDLIDIDIDESIEEKEVKSHADNTNTISTGDDKFPKLEKLKEMFDSGFISKEEMEDMKKEILGK